MIGSHTYIRSIVKTWMGPRVFALALIAGPSVLLTGCPRNETRPGGARVGISTSSTVNSPTVPLVVAFNGERAMDHVRKQIEMGPGPAGSPQLGRTRDYIVNALKSYGLVVSKDEFKAATPQGEKVMANIVVEIAGESKDTVLIASH